MSSPFQRPRHLTLHVPDVVGVHRHNIPMILGQGLIEKIESKICIPRIESQISESRLGTPGSPPEAMYTMPVCVKDGFNLRTHGSSGILDNLCTHSVDAPCIDSLLESPPGIPHERCQQRLFILTVMSQRWIYEAINLGFDPTPLPN